MNEVMNSVNNVIMDNFHKTDNILNDVQTIIEVSQKEAYRSVNTILSQRNWLIGYRIAVEELAGEERAEYGVEIIKNLSRYLTQKYGKGYDRSNLYHCLRFYKAFPQTVSYTHLDVYKRQGCMQSRDLRGFLLLILQRFRVFHSILCGIKVPFLYYP